MPDIPAYLSTIIASRLYMLNYLHQSFSSWQETFSRPTLHLEESLYVRKDLSALELTSMMWRISEQYLGEPPFFIQLKTTDGDTHLAMKFRDLPYFFHQQRNRLWRLDIYGQGIDGQQFFLRLWFHPLSKEANAQIGIVSHQAEEILEIIQDTIGTTPPLYSEQSCLHQRYHISEKGIDMQQLIRELKRISETELLGIPLIASVSTRSGQVFSGLSSYQLLRTWYEHRREVAQVSVGINRLLTEQSLTLTLDMGKGQECKAYLSIMWGDERLQRRIAGLLHKRLNWSFALPNPSDISDQRAARWAIDVGLETIEGEIVGISLESVCSEKGYRSLSIPFSEPHKRWEDRLHALRLVDGWIVDLSQPSPTQWYSLGMAHILGKQVIAISQSPLHLSEQFAKIPLILYQASTIGLSQLEEKLLEFLL